MGDIIVSVAHFALRLSLRNDAYANRRSVWRLGCDLELLVHVVRHRFQTPIFSLGMSCQARQGRDLSLDTISTSTTRSGVK